MQSWNLSHSRDTRTRVQLREYPKRFARELVKLSSSLLQTASGRPAIPGDGVPPALQTFTSMEYGQHDGLFDFADLNEVYIYLRGGEGLNLPSLQWRDVLPTSLPFSLPKGFD